MARKTGKQKAKEDRRRESQQNRERKLIPRWTRFVLEKPNPKDKSTGCAERWSNSRYVVSVFYDDHHTFGRITHLSIKNHDKAPMTDRRDWRDLQRLKNELLGPEVEACEVFPAESRLVDTSNQYHLYCLPSGKRFPFGFRERLVMEQDFTESKHAPGAKQRNWDDEDRPADITSVKEADESWDHGIRCTHISQVLSEHIEGTDWRQVLKNVDYARAALEGKLDVDNDIELRGIGALSHLFPMLELMSTCYAVVINKEKPAFYEERRLEVEKRQQAAAANLR